MSVRGCRWSLWLAFLFTLPVPFFLVERGRVPVARLLELSGVVLSLLVAEGTRGKILVLLALLLGQAIFFMALLWGAAALLSRLMERVSPRRRLVATLVVVIVAVSLASLLEIYRTPFSTRSLTASLLRVYE